MEEEYGRTADLMERATFVVMERGFSASPTPGDDQRILNESFELRTGEDITGHFAPW